MARSSLDIRNYFLASLVGFKADNMYTSTVRSAGDLRAIEGAKDRTLIEGYVKNIPQLSVQNSFTSDILGKFTKNLGVQGNFGDMFTIAANMKGVTPSLSMSKKLGYQGVTLDDITVEFHLYMDDDPILDIFKPITDLLGNALPMRFGKGDKDPTSARNILQQIGTWHSAAAAADKASAEFHTKMQNETMAGKYGLRSSKNTMMAAMAYGGQTLLDLAAGLFSPVDKLLSDTFFLTVPEQMNYDVYLYMGYDGKIDKGGVSGDGWSRAATFISGPWLISKISIELGELVIHPGLPDYAKVQVSLTSGRTGDGQFIRDVYALDRQKQNIL